MSDTQVLSELEETGRPQEQQESQQQVTALPTINHRVLLSLRESARVIGIKGNTIQRIREVNHVKIGLSEKQPGCSDRILSCAGSIANVSNALGDVAETLNDTEGEGSGNEKYAFHFLNHILPPPSKDEIKDAEQLKNIGTLRLLVTSSQLSSIIGKGGYRIKSLIEKHGVKIVASRHFLPDSDERVLEMQGFPGSITNGLIEISEILLNEMDISFASERRYYPHLRSTKEPYTHPAVHDRSKRNHDTTGGESSTDTGKATTTDHVLVVNIPEAYVGAIVGRQGNRIANLRKFTKTKIIVEKKSENKTDKPASGKQTRVFTILGSHMKNVKLAESMLLKNLNAEIEKRESKTSRNTTMSK
ncbi:hypothetical protein HG536_0D04080 [Torulaspora globosa]|uniref:K Homology domain-containing protein n=1 Tax=Torulaspora globosa TaxID=48254 RepID=A0A7G3ZHA0_9SACH|nr:uncharacterized protein HG536_0D04080 [Torulaspora globosa]QLL32886.1 hypothetical protein HG536_0D04080 [Torulaspora globosa]